MHKDVFSPGSDLHVPMNIITWGYDGSPRSEFHAFLNIITGAKMQAQDLSWLASLHWPWLGPPVTVPTTPRPAGSRDTSLVIQTASVPSLPSILLVAVLCVSEHSQHPQASFGDQTPGYTPILTHVRPLIPQSLYVFVNGLVSHAHTPSIHTVWLPAFKEIFIPNKYNSIPLFVSSLAVVMED